MYESSPSIFLCRNLVFRVFIVCVLSAVGCISTANAQEQEELSSIAGETLNSELEVRAMEQEWSAEERRMLAEIEELNAQHNALELDLRHLRQHLEQEHKRIDFYTQRQREIEALREGLEEWLFSAAAAIRTSVEHSIPFLADERQQRLDDLDQVLLNTEESAAEKLRRLMEVFQVEAQYAYSSEVYPEHIRIQGERRKVELVRLGRVALFFITPDSHKCGIYNPLEQGFTYLPDKYAADILAAVKGINGQNSDALHLLPLGRIER